MKFQKPPTKAPARERPVKEKKGTSISVITLSSDNINGLSLLVPQKCSICGLDMVHSDKPLSQGVWMDANNHFVIVR